MNELMAQVRRGERRAIARLITRIENSEAAAETAVVTLYPHTGRAHIVGVTGAPGSGKSSLVNLIAADLRRRDRTVAIVAVDPSSPFTGGALLGDRVRMQSLIGDRGVYMRSMASRGSLGGLAQTTTAVLTILDAAGFDVILVETVGAGQVEVDIAAAAHTTLVVEAPGMGDEIQSIKAGILEIADILIVNKADRPGAAETTRTLQAMLAQSANGSDAEKWQIPLQQTIATEGEGVAELVEQIVAHKSHLQQSGDWLKQEKERSRREIARLLKRRLLAQVQQAVPTDEEEALITAVAERKMDPYTAVDTLLTHTT